MNTYCPGCNQSLKMKQLVTCKFSLTTHDKKDIAHKVISNQDDTEDEELRKIKKRRRRTKEIRIGITN